MTEQRSVLITGGTSGLGYYCAMSIARQHPEYQVILASRTDSTDAAGSINKQLGQTNVRYLSLDLSSLTNIRAFAKRWEEQRLPPIEALLLNAGLQLPGGVSYTTDGFEKTFAVNHIGHALLFSLLRPHLSNTARIVVTSSGTHDPAQHSGLPDAEYNTAEELAHPTAQSAKNAGRQRYATSKLANILWTYALHRRVSHLKDGGKAWTVVSFDPGLMPGTGLIRDANVVVRFLWYNLLPRIIPLLRAVLGVPNIHTAEESGNSLAWVAISPEAATVSGVYYEGRRQIKSSDVSYDEKKQEDLWDWTVRTTAVSSEEKEQFSLRDVVSA